MVHRFWHGIDVDVHIERIGIAVLGARLWATPLIFITESPQRPSKASINTCIALSRTVIVMLVLRCLDDGFASEKLSLGGSAYNFSDGSLFSSRAIHSFNSEMNIILRSGKA